MPERERVVVALSGELDMVAVTAVQHTVETLVTRRFTDVVTGGYAFAIRVASEGPVPRLLALTGLEGHCRAG